MKTVNLTGIIILFFSISILGDPPPPSPDKTSTGSNVDVKVGDYTKTIHIINTNNDNKVISKLYKLKHADPWDLKPILEAAVGAKRINASSTGVQCIKYNDGTGGILISAEKYRFSKEQRGGMSIDELVESLDQPKGSIDDGMEVFIYYPKYRNAAAIARMINNLGLQRGGDRKELLSGDLKAYVDRELNAVIIKTTPSEIEAVKKMLGGYDQAVGKISLLYKVYELFQEDEETIGNEYLAWKRGPGANLFSTGGRFTKGEKTKFVKINKKWNSSFIDFLVTEKKAENLTSGTIVLRNGKRYNSSNSKDSDKTGFSILVLPSIYSKTTTLDMKLGYKSETGNSSLSAKVQILNEGGELIVGGLEKKTKESVSTSPGMLEWLLGGNSDTMKTSKIVVVLKSNPSSADSSMPPETKKMIDEVKKELNLD